MPRVASPAGGCGHLIFGTCFDFQCATPRGLIRDTTVGGNYSLFGHFGLSFKFSMCYPKGAHLWHHRRGHLLTFWAFWITPRGLIHDTTVGCNYSLFGHFGLSLKFSMCYPKGAHSWHHRRGELLTFWAFWIQFQIFNVLPQGGSFTVGGNYSLLGHLWFSLKFSLCYTKGAHSFTHRWLQLHTFWAFWIRFEMQVGSVVTLS